MTARDHALGRPKRDRRIHVREVPTDSRDLRKLARAFIALARGMQPQEDSPSRPPAEAPDHTREESSS